jgi:CysZ protein
MHRGPRIRARVTVAAMKDSESPLAPPGSVSGQAAGSPRPAGPVRSRGIAGLFRGLFAAVHGAGKALGNRDVHRVYFQFTLILLVLSLLLTGLLGYGVWRLTEPESAGGYLARHGLDFLAVGGLWLLRVVGLVISSLAAPLLAFLIVGLLIPVFSEALFLAGLRALDAPRAQALAEQPGLSIAASLWKTLRLLLHLVVFTIAAFAVSLVPVAGVVLGPAVQLWATGKILGWELLDPFFDKQRMAFAAQKAYVHRHTAAVAGFGLAWSFVLAVPLLGPLFFGLAQASAPMLLVRVLEPSPGSPPASVR